MHEREADSPAAETPRGAAAGPQAGAAGPQAGAAGPQAGAAGPQAGAAGPQAGVAGPPAGVAGPPHAPAPARSTLPKHEARRRYVEIAEIEVLEQIRRDSELLERNAIAVGPFARLDANAVAARDGKTRGAISNLFGSQAALQAETMALALSAGDWIERIEYPDPAGFATAEEWVDAFFAGESARGPHRGAEPALDYAFLWALWLSAVPYGMWSDEVAGPSMEEHAQWLARLEEVLQGALDHFGLDLRAGTTLADLAAATASLIEGVWLNQCLTTQHPTAPSEPIDTALRRSGLLLWRGATEPRHSSWTRRRR